jgi:hypothetical protein
MRCLFQATVVEGAILAWKEIFPWYVQAEDLGG